ncbi:MAG: phosphoenolpyruvate--protein phosphotransferase, partial [bacterium]|nr:phosphoenolpyruvate--protein phosphotransferase [bacterium]
MSHTKLRGVGVSPGIAIGEPVVHETHPISTLRIPVSAEGVEDEIARFRSAIEATVLMIQANQKRAQEEMGDEYAAIFEAHQLIASDPSLTAPIEEIIRSEGVNAEWALDQVAARFVAQFEALGDAYLSERKLDVLDVAT